MKRENEQNMQDKAISRRQFAIMGMGAAAIGLVGCASNSEEAGSDAIAANSNSFESASGQVIVDAADMAWDMETDVLVIGCGGAGAAAGIAAREAGAEVIVVERGKYAGGGTALCGQAFACAGSSVQKELGIADSVEAYAEYLTTAADGDEEMLRLVAMNSLDAYEWVGEMGVTTPPVLDVQPGLSFGGVHGVEPTDIPRTHWTEGVWDPVYAYLQQSGADILLETAATNLITDAYTGEIVGAIVGDGGKAIKARKGVVLAAGGFGMNEELVQKHIFGSNINYVCFDALDSMGDGLTLGLSVGADPAFLYCPNDTPSISDGTIYGPMTVLIESSGVFPELPRICVNQQGKRFVQEVDFQVNINRAIMSLPESYCYIIFSGPDVLWDEEREAEQPGIQGWVATANYKEYETVAELAVELGIDPDVLQGTIDEWNKCCANQSDPSFGRTQAFAPLITPPFASEKVFPGMAGTLSSLNENTDMEVLAALTGEPIPRLYTAGNNGNASGRRYACCGSAVASAIVTGRIAGTNAASLNSWDQQQ